MDALLKFAMQILHRILKKSAYNLLTLLLKLGHLDYHVPFIRDASNPRFFKHILESHSLIMNFHALTKILDENSYDNNAE